MQIKLTIIFVCILCIFAVNWTIYQRESVNGKCSSMYPELSVRLQRPVWLPDGGVREGSDGEVYPRDAWWLKDGQVWGCPCSRGKPCLRKCCDLGFMFMTINETIDCFSSDEFYTKPDLYGDVYEKVKRIPIKYEKVAVTQDHFQFITEPRCTPIYYNEYRSQDNIYILTDGTIVHVDDSIYFKQTDFCIEFFEDMNNLVMLFCDTYGVSLERKITLANALERIGKAVITPSILVTMLVYLLVPRLRRGFGRPIMCYLATIILTWISFYIYLYSGHCYTGAMFMKVFSEISVEWWAAVVSYYMWITLDVNATSKLKSRSRFLYCCGLAFGAPLVFVVLGEAADRIPAVPEILKPRFGEKCILKNNLATWIYFIIPSISANLVQLVFSVATIVRLVDAERNDKTLQGTESRRHNAEKINWISLYIKISLILGLNSIIFNFISLLSWIVEVPPVLRHTLQRLDRCRGMEVFLASVCQWDVLSSAVKTLVFWRHNNSPV